MSHEKFDVGEIAIMQACQLPANEGRECEVMELPQAVDYFAANGKWTYAGRYTVRCSGDEWYQVRPEQLRKRRPPQDWVKLCNLTDTPREVEHV